MNKSFSVVGFFLLVIGIVLLLSGYKLINVNLNAILSVASILIGIFLFYQNFGSQKRLNTFLSSVLFFAGIFFLVTDQLVSIDKNRIFLSGLSMIIGLSTLMLFIENVNNRSLLLISLLLITIGSMIAVNFLNLFSFQFRIIESINIQTFWPLILIGLGVKFLLDFKKSKRNNK